ISAIEEVASLGFVEQTALRTVTPAGDVVRLPPPAVSTPHLDAVGRTLPFAPAFGEHTESVLAEAGFTVAEIADLGRSGVTAS
ncbi:MAG: CoA transferase, partial [Acidimicrobiia bacterium]